MASTRKKSSQVGRIIEIWTKQINRFKQQPREYFDEEALVALRESIRAIGQLTPIKVKRLKSGRYELVDGERRLIACRELGIKIRAEVVEVRNRSEQKLLAGVANFGREGHTTTEIAMYIQWAMGDSEVERRVKADLLEQNDGELPKGKRRRKSPNKPTQTEKIEWLARALSHSTAWIYQHMRILRLDEEVQKMIQRRAGETTGITPSFAFELAGAVIDDKKLQKTIAKKVDGMKMKQAREVMYNEIARKGLKPGKQSGPGQRQTLSFNAKRVKRLINNLDSESDRLFDLPDSQIAAALAEFSVDERELLMKKLDEGARKLRIIRLKLANVKKKSKRNGKSTRSRAAA